MWRNWEEFEKGIFRLPYTLAEVTVYTIVMIYQIVWYTGHNRKDKIADAVQIYTHKVMDSFRNIRR